MGKTESHCPTYILVCRIVFQKNKIRLKIPFVPKFRSKIKILSTGNLLSKTNKDRSNLVQREIADRCCHLVNHKKQLQVLDGGLTSKSLPLLDRRFLVVPNYFGPCFYFLSQLTM